MSGFYTRPNPSFYQQRLWGIDLARFIAIVGMMAAHLLVTREAWQWLESGTGGFPSALFAVLGGFGLVFASKRYLRQQNRVGAVVAGAVRGTVILLLGLFLELLPPHPIATILIYYGVALICLSPAVLLPGWALAVIATLLALGGPFAISVLPHPGVLDLSNFSDAFMGVFFGGTYPVVTWAVYLLVGMVACRWLLMMRGRGCSLRAAFTFVGVGFGVGAAASIVGTWYLNASLAPEFARYFGVDAVGARQDLLGSAFGSPAWAGWPAILQVSPHSGSVVDLLRTGGVSVAIVGLCLLVTHSWVRVPFAVRPVVGAGAAPLTSYTFHLVMTAFGLSLAGGVQYFFVEDSPWWVQHGFLLQLGAVLILGAVLSALNVRGPLESLVTRISRAAARTVSKRPHVSSTEV